MNRHGNQEKAAGFGRVSGAKYPWEDQISLYCARYMMAQKYTSVQMNGDQSADGWRGLKLTHRGGFAHSREVWTRE